MAQRPSLSDEKALRMLAALRAGRTLRSFAVRTARFEAYCGAHQDYAREAIPLLTANLKAAHHRKGERFRTMTHCKLGLHPMTGVNVKIRRTGWRQCVACHRVADARARAMGASEVEAVKVALQKGASIGQITQGKPVGGGATDRSLVIVSFKVLKRYRQENPDFDRFVMHAIADSNIVGQGIRWLRVRTRIRTMAAREEANDYRRLLAMLPAYFPGKDAVVSLIIEDLLTGALKREDVRARLQTYISAAGRCSHSMPDYSMTGPQPWATQSAADCGTDKAQFPQGGELSDRKVRPAFCWRVGPHRSTAGPTFPEDRRSSPVQDPES
jgi:hypothetical protein